MNCIALWSVRSIEWRATSFVLASVYCPSPFVTWPRCRVQGPEIAGVFTRFDETSHRSATTGSTALPLITSTIAICVMLTTLAIPNAADGIARPPPIAVALRFRLRLPPLLAPILLCHSHSLFPAFRLQSSRFSRTSFLASYAPFCACIPQSPKVTRIQYPHSKIHQHIDFITLTVP